jgi:hypothetical protein
LSMSSPSRRLRMPGDEQAATSPDAFAPASPAGTVLGWVDYSIAPTGTAAAGAPGRSSSLAPW